MAEHDLQSIALGLDGAEYEPEQFPGLIYRLSEPKTAILLFRSGKVVCTGAKSMKEDEDSSLYRQEQMPLPVEGRMVDTPLRRLTTGDR